MSNLEHTPSGEPDLISADLRARMKDAHMLPLWESVNPVSDKPQQANIWPWKKTGAVMADVGKVASAKVVERRVLMLYRPDRESPKDEAAVRGITCSLQMMLPGEKARPHRHSMNAIRFVVQGSGGASIVDGKRCEMLPGDLILTPGWCWHEHEGGGSEPTIWVDVLDVALHTFMGTSEFQPGPVRDLEDQIDDASFVASGIVPEIGREPRGYSPLFRYSGADAISALAVTPGNAHGFRRVNYTNPVDGGPVLPTIDCSMVQFDAGKPTTPFLTNASTLCVVAEGEGESKIGDNTIAWEKNDVFSVPGGDWSQHTAKTENARLFMISNRVVYANLGLLQETYKS